jgi:hypothetical protein
MMPGRLELDAAGVRRRDRALAVEGHTERVDDAAEQRLAHRHLGDAARAPDLVAFLDVLGVPIKATPTLSSSRFSAMP